VSTGIPADPNTARSVLRERREHEHAAVADGMACDVDVAHCRAGKGGVVAGEHLYDAAAASPPSHPPACTVMTEGFGANKNFSGTGRELVRRNRRDVRASPVEVSAGDGR
jgi:hypothetical protein